MYANANQFEFTVFFVHAIIIIKVITESAAQLVGLEASLGYLTSTASYALHYKRN